MNNRHESDQRECKEPDEFFTTAFFKKIEKICFKTVLDRVGTRQDLQEEVTSETLLRICKYRQKIDFSTGKVWALAKTMANRILIDIMKKGKSNNSKLVEFRPSEELPEISELPDADYESLLEDVMKCISDDVDRIIVQKRIEGYETAENIAPFLKDFGINDPSAVSKRLKKLEDRVTKLIWQGE